MRIRKEYRSSEPDQVSFRAIEENGKRYLEGYASKFNQKSKLIFEQGKLFYEFIDQRAFDKVLADVKNLNVILNFNHDRNKIIARTSSNTLQLTVDEIGLKFRAEIPDVSYANDVYNLVQRNDLFECSFAFSTRAEDVEWTKDEQGNNVRVVKNIARLLDVSVVVDGAYSNTTVSARDAEVKLVRGKTITITIKDEDDEEEPEDMPAEDEPTEEVPAEDAPIDASTGEQPSEDSAEGDWISNCIKTIMDNGETSDEKQAFAICKSKWDSGKRDLPNIKEQWQMQIRLLKLKS